jgi:hypothetical protein
MCSGVALPHINKTSTADSSLTSDQQALRCSPNRHGPDLALVLIERGDALVTLE